jgi:hypothetical protein
MTDVLQALTDYLNERNSLFGGSGTVLLNADGIDVGGITDNVQAGFYVGFDDAQEENIDFVATETNPCLTAYAVQYNVKLVAWFRCVDLNMVSKILLAQLKSWGVFITGLRFDGYNIYEAETGEPLKTDMQVLQITMQVQTATTLTECENLTVCADYCC